MNPEMPEVTVTGTEIARMPGRSTAARKPRSPGAMIFEPVTGSPALTKPHQTPLPIVIGGGGPKRTPALAARFAAEFNTPFVDIDFFGKQRDRVRAACETIGRDPATMTFSAALVVCCGENEAAVARRAAAIGREPAELREHGAAGTPAEVAATLAQWYEAGAERVYLQVLDLADLEHLDLIASTVEGHHG